MKSLALLFSILFFNFGLFAQNGVYLFGELNNSPGEEVEVTVNIYSNFFSTVSSTITADENGQIPVTWVELPSSQWSTIGAEFENCNNTNSTIYFYNDSLNPLIDVYLQLDYCVESVVYGCTDPAAINYNPAATSDNGTCQYEESTGCVEVNLDVFCIDTLSTAYNITVIDDPFCCETSWDQICQQSYIDLGGQPLPECDLTEIYGCTDPEALNYNPDATIDNGTCQYNNEVDNDLCTDATALQPGTQLISNIGAVNNENIWGECWAFGSGEGEQSSIWFSFTTPDEPASIHIEASPDGSNTFTDTQFGLFEECGGEMIYCDGNAGQGLFSAFTFACGELEENTEYILMIDGYFGDMGTCFLTYEVTLGCPELEGCTDPSALNFDASATIDDGSCIYPDSCANNLVMFVLDTQMWGDEISWNLMLDSNVVASGGSYDDNTAYTEWLCLEDGCYTFEMFDSFGDGWNGAVYSFWNPGENSPFASGTLNSGNYGTSSFGLNADCSEECGELTFDFIPFGDPALGCVISTVATYSGDDLSGTLTWDFGAGTPVQTGTDWQSGYQYSANGSYNVCVTYTTANCTLTYCDTFIATDCGPQEIFGCTDPNAINYNPNATINDGSCQYSDSCLTNLAILQINTELWGAEISWSLFNDGNEVASGDGYANYETYNHWICLDDGCYTIELYDSWGDGWNGGTFDLSIDNETIINGTLEFGEFGIYSFGINDEDCETLVSGCTDPEATNYNPLATIDDGSCEYETECTSITMVLDGPSTNQGFFDLYSANGYLLSDGYSGSDQIYEWCLEDGCYELFFITNGGVVSDEIYFTIFQDDSIISGGTILNQTSIINFGVNDDCNPTEVSGCTDPEAVNYNPDATTDDGSCEYEFECGISFTVSPDTTGAQVIWITPSNNIFNAVEVLWDFGDGNTSTDLFPTHTYAGDGPYMLCLTALFANPNSNDFCSITYCAELTNEMINPPGFQSSGFSINVVNPSGVTGLDEVSQITDLNLWPNPTNQFAQLEWTMNAGEQVTIALFDLSGKQAQAASFAASPGKNLYTIDATNLPPGIYVVRIIGQEHQSTTKLINQ